MRRGLDVLAALVLVTAGCGGSARSAGDPDFAPTDHREGILRYDESCRDGVMRACNELGARYLAGEGVPRDPARARQLFERACEGGEIGACFNLAHLFHTGAEGVSVDLALAARYYDRACTGNDMGACSNLGVLYRQGQGVERDPAHAARLYQRACDGGLMDACNNLGILYGRGEGVSRNPETAATLFRRACDNDDPAGCRNLERMRRGTGSPQ